jgi:ELWxxDGT repeat protein
MGGALYFASTDISGVELWRSDGTVAGTGIVKDIHPTGPSSPNNLAALGSTLYFSANDGALGFELWKTDGTAAGTVMVADLRAGSAGSGPVKLTAVGGTLFFAADDGLNGQELWSLNP